MRRGFAVAAGVVFVMLLLLQAPVASGQQVGDRVVLKATHHLGVPLHTEPTGPSPFQRIPDGAVVELLDKTADGRWLNVQLADGNRGWVNKKYVDQVLDPGTVPPPTPPAVSSETLVWKSLDDCLAVVEAGGRMPATRPEALRLATWNIRWFAKGCSPGETCTENATDTDWLACTIAWMDVDLLGVQEILSDPVASHEMAQLTHELDRLTGGAWQSDLQQCGPDKSQHVGFLWNSAAITLTKFADLAQLNGAAAGGATTNACASNLRPGRYAFAQTAGGADFHIASVHLDSGRTDRDYQHRRAAAEQIPFLASHGAPLLDSDEDVLVIGDFNTMGREEPPAISATQELSILDQELEPAFRRMAMTPFCTEYFDNQGGALDHVIVTAGMQEAAVTAQVTGYCAVRNCAPFTGAAPAAFERLSDHCPVVFEVRDEDLDP